MIVQNTSVKQILYGHYITSLLPLVIVDSQWNPLKLSFFWTVTFCYSQNLLHTN